MEQYIFNNLRSTLPMIKVIKLLLIAMLLCVSRSCTKENSQKCEKWEVTYESFNIGACIDFSCGGRRTVQLFFCDKDLANARPGNTIIISQDQCCKKTMTFIRFIDYL